MGFGLRLLGFGFRVEGFGFRREISLRGNQSSWPVGAALAISPTEFPQPPATTETEAQGCWARSLKLLEA